jgi:hypothetical protein
LLAILFRNQQFFPKLNFPVGSKQRATTTLDFEHVFSLLLVFSLFVCTVSTLFALTFLCLSHSTLLIFVLFQTCHNFVNPSIHVPYSTVASNFYSSRDECPTKLWTLPTFSDLANMTREDLTSPVAAAAGLLYVFKKVSKVAGTEITWRVTFSDVILLSI